MKLEFLRLAETIISLQGNKPVVYVSFDGNWGDALIRVGTINFFRHFNIDYTVINHQTSSLDRNKILLSAKLNNQLVVIAGGGAWCGHYQHASNLTQKLQSRFKFNKVLVLPSTFDKHYDIPNTIFFRRDILNSKEVMPKAYFCHDMAFFLAPLEVTGKPTQKEANFFRTDVEKSGKIKVPDNNLDLSVQGTVLSDAFSFFEKLSDYEQINTDRLHVAIGGSILNKQVNLQAGSYFKNYAIFKSSIEPFYPNTQFIE
ncbi:hypothetical protein N7931_07855 [Catenovulum sp. 2E275]|uniref:hypothetical protein n=1 Tax=Catenovulum sp. 2E275 TaxID=2980497 RepID=UPI0021D07F29|nr:hypothetical protein [Catenovulum sp. 2E275]MCU4675549.1 hypothetical protein [Catenovulum sp. 2E275]